MIDLRCQCGEEYHADDAHVGRRIRCLKCERVLSIGPKAPLYRAAKDERQAVTESAPTEGRYREVKIVPSYHARRRVIVAGAALAALILGFIATRLDPPTAPLAPPAKGEASPAKAKEQEIVDEDAGKPGDPELGKEYQEINERYFRNKFSLIPVLWEPRLRETGPLKATGLTEEGLFWASPRGGKSLILLNPQISGDAAETRRVLCHEMVHEYLFTIGDTNADHGPAFQAELRRLLTEGAFQAILASEDEKASLGAWLDREAGRLDRESAVLDRDQDGIARARGSLDRDTRDLNQRISRANEQGFGWPSDDAIEAIKARETVNDRRVADFNANVERHNADCRSFNLKASSYNLMRAYPDGLEESTIRVRPLEPRALP